jgi:S-formylglutathione hydrolase FrmB
MKKMAACFAVFASAISLFAGAHLEILDVPGNTLKNNPLHDPVERRAAIFLPGEYNSKTKFPVIYYLPGWSSSSENYIRKPAPWIALVNDLSANVAPMIFVVVDARTRWGGSQYLNSSAQGNYADYVCDEIVSLVESKYSISRDFKDRIIAGHSSGGFGALRLGMARQDLFGAVIALAADSDFPVSHLPFLQIVSVKDFTPADVDALFLPNAKIPTDGDLIYVIGLSAAYAPTGNDAPGRFDWMFDEHGIFQKEVWQRWLENDPLTVVEKNEKAFSPEQKIYLDGGTKDQYKANIGAKAIYEIVKKRKSPCAFYEPPVGHGDFTPERIERGLAWVFGKPLLEVTTNGVVRASKSN